MASVFPFVNNASQNVQDKYLEGMPYKGNFPGPFLGKSNAGMQQYTTEQRNAVKNWDNKASNPLKEFSKTFPDVSSLSCDVYTSDVRMFPTFDPNSQNVFNRSATNNLSTFHRSPGGQDLWRNNPQNPLTESFKDNTVTDPCNQTGFGKISPEFVKFPDTNIPGWYNSQTQPASMGKSVATGNPLLDIENRPVDQFSHNNMVPYYGSKLTQNMRGTGVPQAGDNNSSMASTDGFAAETPWHQKLSIFTGCDDMYMHKREVGPMFSPAEQQTGWVFGSPDFRPDLDRYKQGVWKRDNESPVEKIQVGPGLGLDYTIPAAGGFQQFTRILPNNVNDYKSNQLEGRVTAGKWFAADHPTSQYINGVNQNQPKVEWTQARRPTMPSKFMTNAPSGPDARVTDYNTTVDKGKQARSDTEIAGGYGQLEYNNVEMFTDSPKGDQVCVSYSPAPVGMVMGSHVSAQAMDRQSYNTIRETFKRGSAGYDKNGYWECLDQPQGSNRWDLIMGPGKGVVPNGEQRDGWYVNLTDRGDVNPYVINVTGTVSGGGVWQPNSFQDQQKVTTKETTAYSYVGNAGQKPGHTENMWTDNQKVTTKETTAYSHHGGPTGSKPTEMFWTDDPKVTTKETTAYAHVGSTRGAVPGLSNRFMYEGSNEFNPKLNSGKGIKNNKKQAYEQIKTPSNTSFVPGLSNFNNMLNREEFTVVQNGGTFQEFVSDVKNTFSELFGLNSKESFEDVEDTRFDPNLFLNGSPQNSIQPEDNNINAQWRKGGMTTNGLRASGEVWNWFPTPGRSNLIPDPKQPFDTNTTNPSKNAPVSSIGTYQTNGLKSVTSGVYGPGTLLSANVNVRSEAIPGEAQQGYMRQNGNKSQFVDYRSTAPFLVNQLRKNPLSIYATREHINDPLPEFFNFVKPDNFSTYITEPDVHITNDEKELYIDGAPQTTILGLYKNNPLMGISTGIPNATPKFSGKAYSGKQANLSIYDMNWQNDFGDYVESFDQGQRCQNKALDFASQGYNISNQINNDNFIQYGPRTNLPWGPKHVTGNPLTQLGGLWNGQVQNNTVNVVNKREYPLRMTNHSQGTFSLDQRLPNPYKDGLPGSLVA